MEKKPALKPQRTTSPGQAYQKTFGLSSKSCPHQLNCSNELIFALAIR